jgi:hypothetical protein
MEGKSRIERLQNPPSKKQIAHSFFYLVAENLGMALALNLSWVWDKTLPH